MALGLPVVRQQANEFRALRSQVSVVDAYQIVSVNDDRRDDLFLLRTHTAEHIIISSFLDKSPVSGP